METTLKDKISELYGLHKEKIFSNDPPEIIDIREKSFNDFLKPDFPTTR